MTVWNVLLRNPHRGARLEGGDHSSQKKRDRGSSIECAIGLIKGPLREKLEKRGRGDGDENTGLRATYQGPGLRHKNYPRTPASSLSTGCDRTVKRGHLRSPKEEAVCNFVSASCGGKKAEKMQKWQR